MLFLRGQQHFLKGFHGNALGTGCILDQVDEPFWNRLRKVDLEHRPSGKGGSGHGLRVETDAQIALHHREDLIHGAGFHFHMKSQIML